LVLNFTALYRSNAVEKEFLTTGDVAYALGVTTGRIYQLIAEGKLPAVRIGGRVRVPRDLWEQWLSEKKAEAGRNQREPVAA
jgi:excisionase family DNA binding protein